METAIEKSKNYVNMHKKCVKKAFDLLLPDLTREFNLTNKQIEELKQQIAEHDNSKFSPEEFEPYANYFFGEKNEQTTKEFKIASVLHKARNAHHPEFWQARGEVMPLNYVIEMVCDWWAFSLLQNLPTETLNWYASKKQTLGLTPQTTATTEKILDIIRNLVKEQKI